MGITVKPNGKFLARVRVGGGKRESKVFNTKREANDWIDSKKNGDKVIVDMTVNKWFDFWINNLMTDLRINTVLSYKDKYKTWIGPSIGRLKMTEVKPYHLMEILNNMKIVGRKTSTIDQTRLLLHLLFAHALENGIVSTNPVTRSVRVSGTELYFDDVRFLTRSEEETFLKEAKRYNHYNVYAFILQTGLRYGELTGLKWSDIDFENRLLRVQRSCCFYKDCGEFMVGEPKTKSGYRLIYLTDRAIDILDGLDRKSEYVFTPTKRCVYNKQLRRICKRAGIEPLSIHKLRHTFATRCIESGMRPKTLQKILGHSDITITLNYYVHVADDEMALEMNRFSTWAPGGN